MHPDVFFDMGVVVHISAQDKCFVCTSTFDTCVNLEEMFESESTDDVSVEAVLYKFIYLINWGTQVNCQYSWITAVMNQLHISSFDQNGVVRNIPDYFQF